MIKRLILSLCFIVIAGSASAQQYAKAIFYGDVELRSWTALSSFTASTTTGALTGTYYYRASGTNLAGRIPATSVTNLTCSSNGVILRWKRKDGLMGYVVERSTNGTMWDEWRAVSITLTNLTDTGALTWSAGGFTNLFTAIPAPQAIGFGTGVSVVAFSGVTGIPEDNSELVRWGAEIGAEADTNALAQLRIETNRAQLAEAALGLRIDGTNGLVSKADTNTWETGSHADLYPRNNPSNYTTAADITAATGTLGTASRSYADAAVTAGTGAVATALRADIVAATNPLASRDWVAAQGYGTGTGGGTPTRVEAGSNVTVQASVDGGTNVYTVNASAGGSDYVLPQHLTNLSYTIGVTNYSVLIATHNDRGASPDASGVYIWNPSKAGFYLNGGYGTEEREVNPYLRTYIDYIDPYGNWTNSNPGPLHDGTYYPADGHETGTITFVYAVGIPISDGVGALASGIIVSNRYSAGGELGSTKAYDIIDASEIFRTVNDRADIVGTFNGSRLTGITAGQVGAVSNTPAGISAAGGVTNGGATVNGQAISNGAAITIPTNASGYAAYTITPANGTATVTRSMGKAAYVAGGSPLTITVQSADWEASNIGCFALGVYSTGLVTFLPATMTNAQAASSWSTTATNNLIFFKGVGQTIWVGR